nr:hypothetical protein Iba_chr09aCG5850 [Ipomoea batatas]
MSSPLLLAERCCCALNVVDGRRKTATAACNVHYCYELAGKIGESSIGFPLVCCYIEREKGRARTDDVTPKPLLCQGRQPPVADKPATRGCCLLPWPMKEGRVKRMETKKKKTCDWLARPALGMPSTATKFTELRLGLCSIKEDDSEGGRHQFSPDYFLGDRRISEGAGQNRRYNDSRFLYGGRILDTTEISP